VRVLIGWWNASVNNELCYVEAFWKAVILVKFFFEPIGDEKIGEKFDDEFWWNFSETIGRKIWWRILVKFFWDYRAEKFGDKSTRNSGLSVGGLQFPVALN
jgi:hypothetical protein